MKYLTRGFTIVELLIVITVIAILASITVVSYNGVTQRGEYTKASTDLRHINDAITVYRSQNGTYFRPTAAGTSNPYCAAAHTALGGTAPPGMPSFVPSYIDAVPVASNKTGYSYKYCVNDAATEYKLLRVITGGLPGVEKEDTAKINTAGTDPGTAANRISWGYWSTGGASL